MTNKKVEKTKTIQSRDVNKNPIPVDKSKEDVNSSVEDRVEEFKKKFTDNWESLGGKAVVYPCKEGVSEIIPAEDMVNWLTKALQQQEERVRREERELFGEMQDEAYHDGFGHGLSHGKAVFYEDMEKIERFFDKAPIDYDDRKTRWIWFVDKITKQQRIR